MHTNPFAALRGLLLNSAVSQSYFSTCKNNGKIVWYRNTSLHSGQPKCFQI